MSDTRTAQKGFTLLEVMLATAILGMLSLLAFSVLSQSVDLHQRVQVETQRLNQVQRAMHLFDNDLLQIVARPARSTGSMLVSGEKALFSTQTRDPQSPLNDELLLQTIHWYVQDSTLYRAQRTFVDGEKEYTAQAVLHDVSAFHLESDTVSTDALPASVTLTLRHNVYGQLQRRFALPQTVPLLSNNDKKAR